MAVKSTKKEKEYRILNKVYTDPKIRIQSSEEPDFIITANDERFGVEITEFYYNEASARLKNYPGYIEKILSSSTMDILNKNDKGIIEKHSLYVKSNNGKYQFFSDVIEVKYNEEYEFGQLPEFKDVEVQIAEIVERKSKKAEHYNKQLKYIELFIYDKENYIHKNLQQLNNSDLIAEMVRKSNFKRVYIFSGNYLTVMGVNPEENMTKYNTKNDGENNDKF